MRITYLDKSQQVKAVELVKSNQADIIVITEEINTIEKNKIYVFTLLTSNKKVYQEIEKILDLISLKKNF